MSRGIYMLKTIYYYTDWDNACFVVGTTFSFLGYSDMVDFMQNRYMGCFLEFVEVSFPQV